MSKKIGSVARQAWLAGVGAYDNGREKAADKFDQLFVEGSAFVHELLEKGESIETQLQAKLEARKMLRDKILALRTTLGLGNNNRDEQIKTLSARVDNLIDLVAKLAQVKTSEQETASQETTEAAKPVAAKKAPVKRTAAKPAAAKTASKVVAKPAAVATASTVATKPAAAKTPTKSVEPKKD
jgi:peptidoglycan hydrolase CwlO-like protein